MSDDLAFAGLAAQAELVRAGAVSPSDLVALSLARIERLDSELNAFREVLAERATEDARRLEGVGRAQKWRNRMRRRQRSDELPLLGVPVAVKDCVDVEGVVTTHGTGCFEAPAGRDDELVSRLRAAGAIVIGKTTLPEFAIYGFTESKTWGVTRNPWDTERTPGGSSGGSAAAVAAGLVAGATASDGAGSIRIPAANCGLFGLKPQRGRVPITPADHWHGLSVNGCVTRRVIDTALYLDVTANRGAGSAGPPPPARPYVDAASTPPGRLRIAWSLKPPRLIAPPIVEEEVRDAVERVAEQLASLGHAVARQNPHFGSIGNALTPRYLCGIQEDVEAAPNQDRLEKRTRGMARLGARTPRRQLRRAVAAEASISAKLNAIFDDHDVLITPTVGRPPVRVGKWDGRGALRTVLGMSRTYPFTGAWNFTGQPAAAVPAGWTREGLPLSVQLIGRPGDEATLISLAAQLEAETHWTERRPPAS
jgi:amidase